MYSRSKATYFYINLGSGGLSYGDIFNALSGGGGGGGYRGGSGIFHFLFEVLHNSFVSLLLQSFHLACELNQSFDSFVSEKAHLFKYLLQNVFSRENCNKSFRFSSQSITFL